MKSPAFPFHPLAFACALLASALAPSTSWSQAATIAVADASGQRGAAGTTQPMVFTVTRTGDTSFPVSLTYATLDGSAKAGVDYVAQRGKLEIAAGERSAVVSVDIIGRADRVGDKPTRFDLLVGRPKAGPADPNQLSFTPAGTAPIGFYALGSAVADFNGDGRPDVVLSTNGTTSADSLGNLSFLRNDAVAGSATAQFTPALSFAGHNPAKIRAGDINRDGKPDLIASVSSANAIAVYINTTPVGSSQFSFVQTIVPTLDWGSTGDVALGDFDGDGIIDIVATNPIGRSGPGDRALVLRNTTPVGATVPVMKVAATAPASLPPFPSIGARPQAVEVADFNRDGRLDFVLANLGTAQAAVMLNTTPAGTSTPTFASPRLFDIWDGADGMAVGDLDGDGTVDIVTASQGINEAARSFAVLMNETAPGSGKAAFHDAAIFFGFATNDVQLADMDKDGRLDIVLDNQCLDALCLSGGVNVIRNLGTPGVKGLPELRVVSSTATGLEPRTLALLDINGDGRLDFVTGHSFEGAASFALRSDVPPSAVITDKRAIGTIRP